MHSSTNPEIITLQLPGPDRKRLPARYTYRLRYRMEADGPGCMLLWEVQGGRLPYQIALERTARGTLRFHCTCADAIFKAEASGRLCKHVKALLEVPTARVPTDPEPRERSA